jgi:hypothetical protein
VEVTSTCENWSLVNVDAFQVAPEDPPLTDPATVCEVIFSPPSLMLVQVPVRFPLAHNQRQENYQPGCPANAGN